MVHDRAQQFFQQQKNPASRSASKLKDQPPGAKASAAHQRQKGQKQPRQTKSIAPPSTALQQTSSPALLLPSQNPSAAPRPQQDLGRTQLDTSVMSKDALVSPRTSKKLNSSFKQPTISTLSKLRASISPIKRHSKKSSPAKPLHYHHHQQQHLPLQVRGPPSLLKSSPSKTAHLP